MESARKTYERANRNLVSSEKEERLLLLESWMLFETKHGDEDTVAAVRNFIDFENIYSITICGN